MGTPGRDWMEAGGEVDPSTVSRPAWAVPQVSAAQVKAWSPGGGEAPAPEPPPAPGPEPAVSGPAEDAPSAEPEAVAAVHRFDDAQLAELQEAIVAELREPYLAAARSLATAVGELEQRIYDDVVDLAVRLAEAVIQRTVALDRDILVENTRRALRIAGPVSRMTLKCAEEDAPFLREQIDDLVKSEIGRAVEVTVRPSDDIDLGGCLLTFDSGIVDARVPQQLARLADAVRAALHDTAARRAAKAEADGRGEGEG